MLTIFLKKITISYRVEFKSSRKEHTVFGLNTPQNNRGMLEPCKIRNIIRTCKYYIFYMGKNWRT